ncbi:MAG: hypothetical protein HWE14_04225 [Flavobacteriia bacterium]|nr:hypothetical protein [Flavobacteriia bacterium]
MRRFQHNSGFILIDDWKIYFQKSNSSKSPESLPSAGGFLPYYLAGAISVSSIILVFIALLVPDSIGHYSEWETYRVTLVAIAIALVVVGRLNTNRIKKDYEEYSIRIINIERILCTDNRVIFSLKQPGDKWSIYPQITFSDDEFAEFTQWLNRSKLSSLVHHVWTPANVISNEDEKVVFKTTFRKGMLIMSNKSLWISNFKNRRPLKKWKRSEDSQVGSKLSALDVVKLATRRLLLLVGLLWMIKVLLPGLLSDIGLESLEFLIGENVLIGIVAFGLFSALYYSKTTPISFQTSLQNLSYVYMDERALCWRIGVNRNKEVFEFQFNFPDQDSRLGFIEFLVKSSNSDFGRTLTNSSCPTQSSHLASE